MKKKYLITIAGGIGNQMMQYALYLNLKSQKIDCNLYLKPDNLNDHHEFNIDKLFANINIPKNKKFLNSYISFFISFNFYSSTR